MEELEPAVQEIAQLHHKVEKVENEVQKYHIDKKLMKKLEREVMWTGEIQQDLDTTKDKVILLDKEFGDDHRGVEQSYK
ncbi:hypothetical protein R1flu_008613 [Riccia fluitans]|uniref:Uncharacterized protein n=1 Tax=Riccia fluitans TaxID=41844 RepID=A0ABD1YC77_9MARC